MRITKEKLESITSIKKLFKAANIIRKECIYAYCKNGMKNNQKIVKHQLLETYAYKLAVNNATTAEELETCAIEVEENSVYCPNPDEWADNIRIQAYGLEWFLKEQLNSAGHQEFKKYLKENNIENPFEELEQALNGTIEGETYAK